MVNKRPGVNSSICCNCGQEVLLTQPWVLLRLTWSLFLLKSTRSVMLKQGLRQAIINLSKDWTKNKGKTWLVGKIRVFDQLFTYFNKPVTETKKTLCRRANKPLVDTKRQVWIAIWLLRTQSNLMSFRFTLILAFESGSYSTVLLSLFCALES